MPARKNYGLRKSLTNILNIENQIERNKVFLKFLNYGKRTDARKKIILNYWKKINAKK